MKYRHNVAHVIIKAHDRKCALIFIIWNHRWYNSDAVGFPEKTDALIMYKLSTHADKFMCFDFKSISVSCLHVCGCLFFKLPVGRDFIIWLVNVLPWEYGALITLHSQISSLSITHTLAQCKCLKDDVLLFSVSCSFIGEGMLIDGETQTLTNNPSGRGGGGDQGHKLTGTHFQI